MKKMKLLGALALASCVVLGGCNKPTEPSANPSIVVEGVPVEALIGDVFDFDSYVKVQDSSESFSIELSEGGDKVAKVEGHKVTFIGEGTVTITAKLGELSGSAQVSVVAPLRKEFAKWAEGIGDDYYLMTYGYEEAEAEEGSEEPLYELVIGGLLTHGEKYSYNEEFEVLGEDSSGNYVYATGGYLEASDGNIYTYLVEGEGDDAELVFEVRGNEPLDMSEVAAPFSIDASKLVYHPAADDYAEDLYLPASVKGSEAQIKSILQITENFADYGCKYLGTYIEDFDLVYVDEETKKEEVIEAYSFMPMVEYQSKEVAWNAYIMIKDSDNGVPLVEEYLASEAVPEGYSFDNFATILEYFGDIEAGFKLSIEYGMYDESGEKLSLSEEEAKEYGVFGEASGVVNAYVSEDWVHVEEVGLEHLSIGHTIHEDKVYSYAYDAESEKYKAKEVEGAASFEDLDPELNFSFFDHETLVADEAGTHGIYDEIFVNKYASMYVEQLGANYLLCEFSAETGFDLLSYLLYYSVPKTGEEDRWALADIFYALYYYDWIWDMEVYMQAFVSADGTTPLSIEISSMMPVASDEEGNLFSWGFNVSFGEYVAPEGVAIEYPAAA